jgi:hypothetical protein
LFLALLFLFLRFLPMISIFEMRTLVPDNDTVRLKPDATAPLTSAAGAVSPGGLR